MMSWKGLSIVFYLTSGSAIAGLSWPTASACLRSGNNLTVDFDLLVRDPYQLKKCAGENAAAMEQGIGLADSTDYTNSSIDYLALSTPARISRSR
jgi:hypothetical protein